MSQTPLVPVIASHRFSKSRRTYIAIFALVAGMLFASPLAAHAATTYYVDATAGSDSNAGTATTAPWKTITKVNTKTFVAGDYILFKRGETFYGTVNVKQSGTSTSPIMFGAYGTGNKPVISGLTTLSNWTSVGGGIWKASAPTANTTANPVNLVTLNGTPQAVGRYPNADAPNKGYLSYESFSGVGGAGSSITDTALSGTTDWYGAELAVRKNHWSIDKGLISNHTTGTTINYTSTGTESPNKNYGYFVQRDIKTLDQFGEWYFDPTTKELNMYFGSATPSSYTVKISTLDTLFNMGRVLSTDYIATFITIDGLAFDGANNSGIFTRDGSNITIKNTDLTSMGAYGIYMWNDANVLIDNVYTNYNLAVAIYVRNSTKGNVAVQNSRIMNTGTLQGMGYSDPSSFKALQVITNSGSGITIQNNVVENSGYVGIAFQGNTVLVKNNVVNNFDLLKQDGGGIYTYVAGTEAAPQGSYTNRIVDGNVVTNGIGAPEGTSSTNPRASGIYLDGRTMNVTVSNNTLINNSLNGITSNNPSGITLTGNTISDSSKAITFTKWAWGAINNLTINNNIIYQPKPTQMTINYTNAALADSALSTYQTALRAVGTINNNYYNTSSNQLGFVPELYTASPVAAVSAPLMSLQGWQEFSGYDAGAIQTTAVPQYVLINTIGTNPFTNGKFTTNMTGINANATNLVWDGTNKIDGGSLKVFFPTTTNKYALAIGNLNVPVSSTKKYVLRFTTLGTTNGGIVKAYLRNTATPYAMITGTEQFHRFGAQRMEHEFLFDASTTSPAASLVIGVNDYSGTTYIDNIEFYEVNATSGIPTDTVRVEYNATTSPKTVTFTGGYDSFEYDNTLATTIANRVTKKTYIGSVTIPPLSGKILFRPAVGSPDTVPPIITLTAPAAGTILGTATLSATALDNVGVAKVDFYYGSNPIASDTVAPYTIPWVTTGVANGGYTVSAVAYDTAGNFTTSTPVVVTVANPDITVPTVSLTAPLAGTVSGTMTLSATASDNVAVSKVDFYQGNTVVGTATVAPYTASWNTTTVANGSYQLKAVATDSSGNIAPSSLVTVTISNVVADTIVPTVTYTSALSGTVSGTTSLSATASDNIGVARVEFYAGSTLVGTATVAPYTASWNTTTVANGSYTVKAIAYDAAGNSATSTVGTLTVSNTIVPAGTVTLTTPLNNAIVSGTVAITATVSSGTITKVDFYKDTDSTPFATTASSYVTFFDTTTVVNGTHTFKAVATDSIGQTSTSPSITVTVSNAGTVVPGGTAAGAPTSVVALPGYGRASVTAVAPSSVGGSAITSYSVTSSPGNIVVVAPALPISVANLTNGTPYTFTVRAYNAAGAGAVSAPSNAVTPMTTFTVGRQVIVRVATTLTVRQTAGGTKIGNVTTGTNGTVLQNGSGSTQVQFPSITGWVSSNYIFQTN